MRRVSREGTVSPLLAPALLAGIFGAGAMVGDCWAGWTLDGLLASPSMDCF